MQITAVSIMWELKTERDLLLSLCLYPPPPELSPMVCEYFLLRVRIVHEEVTSQYWQKTHANKQL